MDKPLLLKICVANPMSDISEIDKVYMDIVNNVGSAEFYQLDRSKVTGAAIEFVAILTSSSAIATIAKIVYEIWKKHKQDGDLYVAVNPEKGIQIMISEKTSAVELQIFQEKINAIYRTEPINALDENLLTEVKKERIWLKLKKS
jgi:hypothetical protein